MTLIIRRLPHGGFLVIEPSKGNGLSDCLLFASDSLTMALAWMEQWLRTKAADAGGQ